jgi:hypothetical protein
MSLSYRTPEGRTTRVGTEGSAIDLSGQPKVLLTIGPGSVGKTTALRYIAERAAAQKRATFFAAIDPENHELSSYFEGVQRPPSFEPDAVVAWLEKFLALSLENKATAAIDMGGADINLGRLVASDSTMVQVTENAGVAVVALYLLSPRLSDLAVLAALEQAGFHPTATAIVLNEGRMSDPTVTREEAFARTMQHGAYKAAVKRGAQQIWMPRLSPAKEVEDRRITFGQARDATMISGRCIPPLGRFDRMRVCAWLDRMDTEWAQIGSWLP